MYGNNQRVQTGSSFISSSQTRHNVLWNVVQPGDHYDIRKSMIAQLPGDSNHFMGDNLQIVCLLQSAEIERLCEFLDDYKYRYREMERRELDRHSYEVQIKQLTQRLADEGSFKSENLKLKEFIKKLTNESEELKGNRYSVDSSLRLNYEKALLQIQSLNKEISSLSAEHNNLFIQNNNYLAKIQAVENAKERQLRELFDKYAVDSKNTIQIETMSIKSRYDSQINRFQFEIKRLKEFNENKNSEINQLNGKNRALMQENQQLERRLGQSTTSNSQQIEERFTLFGQQIERLNLILKQSTSKLDETSRNQLIWQQKCNRIEFEYRTLEQTNRQLEDQIYSLKQQTDKSGFEMSQSQTIRLQQDLNRLKLQIRRLQDERSNENQKYFNLQHQYNELEYQVSKITILERENTQFKTNMANYQELKRRVAEYQNKIAMLSLEVQRLTNVIATNQEIKRMYDEINFEFEDFKRKSLDKERVITTQYESEIQRRIAENQSKVNQYTQQNGMEFQTRIQSLNREMERLNIYLKEKTEQTETHKRKIRELESSIHSKYQVEMTRKITTYETNILELRNYSEDLSRKYKELEMNNRRIPEYQNKIALMSQEIERNNGVLRTKTDQLQNTRRQLRDLEFKFSNTSNMQEMETSRKFTLYEENQTRLNKQNEDLRRKIQQIVELKRNLQEYENRLIISSQQIQRLNQALREKVNALNSSETNIRNLNQQLQSLRRNKIELQSNFSHRFQSINMETSRKIGNFEQNMGQIQRQNEDLKRRLNELTNEHQRKGAQYQNKIALMKEEIERLNFNIRNTMTEADQMGRTMNVEYQKITTEAQNQKNIIIKYEQNLAMVRRQNQDLKRKFNEFNNQHNRKIAEYQNKIALMKEEIDRLNNNIRNTMTEADRAGKTMNVEYQKIVLEIQNQKNIVIKYEENINMLNRENEDLKRKLTEMTNESNRKITDYQSKIRNTMSEADQIGRTMNVEYQKVMSQSQNQKNIIIKFQQNAKIMGRENQDLKRKLNELNNQNNRKMAEYQNKIALMKEEIDRLNHNIRNTITQADQMGKNMNTEFQKLLNDNNQMKSVLVKNQENINILNNRVRQLTQENQRITRNAQQEQQILKRTITELKTEINNRHENVNKFEMETSRKISTYEQNINVVVRERDQMKRALLQYETTLKNMTRQLEQSKRRGVEIENQYRKLVQEHELTRKNHQELQTYLKVETSQRFKNYEDNIQNLNRELENYRNKIIEYEAMRKAFEAQNQNMGREIQNQRMKIGEYENMRKSFEQNNVKMNQETEKLVMRIRELETSITQKYEVETSRKITMFEQNVNGLSTQNEELRRNIMNYQQNINRMNADLEELKRALNKRNEDYGQLEQKYRFETENYLRQIKETQINITNTYNQKTSIYEQNINHTSKENEELKRMINQLTKELERINHGLKTKVEEHKQAENMIRNLQAQIENLHRKMQDNEVTTKSRYESEFTRTTSMYEQKTVAISKEYDNYKFQTNRKIAEYQNRIAMLSQELERANNNLRGKTDEVMQFDSQFHNAKSEIQRLTRSLHEQEQMNSKRFETQMSRTVSTYESKFTGVSRQYEEYRRVNERKMGEWENKYLQLQTEIQRLNGALRQKLEQANNHERNLMKLNQENQMLKRNFKEAQISWNQRYESEVTRTTTTYERDIVGLRNNATQYERRLHELSRKVAEDQNKIAMLSQEIERLNQALRVKVDESSKFQMEVQRYQQENQHLKTNISGHYASEIEKLTLTVRQRTEENQKLQQTISQLQSNQDGEFRQLQNSYTLVSQEYENSKKHLIEYEQSIKKLYSEFERLQIIINELKTERQSLFEKNHGLIQEIERLTSLANDQEEQLAEVRIRLSDDVALQKRINEHMALMVVLFAEIESLRQRVKDKEKEVQEVRRSSLAPFKA